jgi:hypothetical protein
MKDASILRNYYCPACYFREVPQATTLAWQYRHLGLLGSDHYSVGRKLAFFKAS